MKGNQFIENAMMYGDSIKAYDNYLNYIAYLVKVLGLPNNAISQAIVLKRIMDWGTFSDDQEFNIVDKYENDLVGFWGMHIMEGIATCRHIANFEKDVLAKNYLMAEPFYCSISNVNADNPGNLVINHAINLIYYKGVYYGYDATNDKLFHFIHGMKMEELYSDNPLYAYYVPEIKFSQNGHEIADIKYDVNAFEAMADKPILSEKEYTFIKNYSDNAVYNNLELLDDFYDSSKKYIRKINDRKQ